MKDFAVQQLCHNLKMFPKAVFENMGKKFWEVDPAIWDSINNTGLRYVRMSTRSVIYWCSREM